MFSIQCEECKNQTFNSTSCRDNTLRLLVLVMMDKLYRGLQVMSSFSIWSCVSKDYIERGIFGRAKLCLMDIEDFNLEQWSVGQSLGLGRTGS